MCALKPIRQARAGDPTAALTTIAKSAFRRIPRLVLPTSIATLLIWFVCQLGGFKVAKVSESWWLGATSPAPSISFKDAWWDLLYNEVTTWTHGWNIYDGNQWTLPPLLRGSMFVFVFLFATIYMQARWRMAMSLGMFVFYYIASDCESMPMGPMQYSKTSGWTC